MSDLANAPAQGSVIQDASGDASIVVGFTLDSQPNPPFVWDIAQGMRPLRALLEQGGTDLTGWELGAPLAISHDGRVVFGEGTCGGVPAVYRASAAQERAVAADPCSAASNFALRSDEGTTARRWRRRFERYGFA